MAGDFPALALEKGAQAAGGAAGVQVPHPQGLPRGVSQLAEGLHGVEGVAIEQEVVAVRFQVRPVQHPAQDVHHLGQQGAFPLALGLGGGGQLG